MRAVTFQAPNEVRVEEKPDPEVGAADEALIRVEASGICGSDLHIYHGRVPVEQGFTIGHEYVGTVLAVGDGVERVAVGDRVLGCFHTACGTCPACVRGDYHRCERQRTFGHGSHLGDLQGAQAELLLVPRANLTLRRVPEGMSDEAALFAGDVMGTGYHAVAHAGMRSGDKVAVLGLGPVGLCAMQAALAGGAVEVFAIDSVEARLEMASSFGATPIHLTEEEPKKVVRAATEGRGVDVVVDAVGDPGAAGDRDQPLSRRRHRLRDRRLRRQGGGPARARLAQGPAAAPRARQRDRPRRPGDGPDRGRQARPGAARHPPHELDDAAEAYGAMTTAKR